MEIQDVILTEVAILQENHPLPDGRLDPGLLIVVRVVPVGPDGTPLPVATRAFRYYYRMDEVPDELSLLLDQLFSILKPNIDQVRNEIQREAEPLKVLKLDKMIKEKATKARGKHFGLDKLPNQ